MFKWIVVGIALCSGVGTIPVCVYLFLCHMKEEQIAREEVLRKLNNGGVK